jgi:POT family proton-dependent oligopeptide transporter
MTLLYKINNNYFSLRSFISALFWLMIGIAAAICIGLTPVSQDPYLVWMYGSLGIVSFVAGGVFYVSFRKSASLDPDALDIVQGVEGNREEVLQVADSGKHSGA